MLTGFCFVEIWTKNKSSISGFSAQIRDQILWIYSKDHFNTYLHSEHPHWHHHKLVSNADLGLFPPQLLNKHLEFNEILSWPVDWRLRRASSCIQQLVVLVEGKGYKPLTGSST
jgi:hypothetical protein